MDRRKRQESDRLCSSRKSTVRQVWMREDARTPMDTSGDSCACRFFSYFMLHSPTSSQLGLGWLEKDGGLGGMKKDAGMGATDPCTMLEVCSHHCALLYSPEIPSQPPRGKGTAHEPWPAPSGANLSNIFSPSSPREPLWQWEPHLALPWVARARCSLR